MHTSGLSYMLAAGATRRDEATIKFSTPAYPQESSTAPQRNLGNSFSGFIEKSASFPCLWNPFPGFGRNLRRQKMGKSISAKMWWSGLHYLLVACNLRQGVVEQIEFFEKFLGKNLALSMDIGQWTTPATYSHLKIGWSLTSLKMVLAPLSSLQFAMWPCQL